MNVSKPGRPNIQTDKQGSDDELDGEDRVNLVDELTSTFRLKGGEIRPMFLIHVLFV